MRVILASVSPRRKELLSALIDDFEVIPSDVEEPLRGDPIENAETLALAKARDVLVKHPESVVIGADTIVFLGGKSYGKPDGVAGVVEMWRELRGRPHGVVTGFALVAAGFERTGHSVAEVTLTHLDDEAVRNYAASGRPFDKAGAYAIQDEDVPTVATLHGCYCNVMGLPLHWLKEALEEAGVPCRDPGETFPRCRECGSRP